MVVLYRGHDDVEELEDGGIEYQRYRGSHRGHKKKRMKVGNGGAKKAATRTRICRLMKITRARTPEAMTHGATEVLTAVGSANGTRARGET